MSSLSMDVEKLSDKGWGSCELFDKDQKMTTAKVLQDETRLKGSERHSLKAMVSCI